MQTVCVKTYGGDKRGFVEFQSSSALVGPCKFCICVPEADLESFRKLVAPGSLLITNEELLARFGVHCKLRESWSSQQLFKLLLVAVSSSEINWVLDANTLLLQPLPEFSAYAPVPLALDALLPEEFQWFTASAKFLGLPPPEVPMATVNQPLRRSVVQEMLGYIARRSGKNPVEELIDQMVRGQRAGRPAWTEYGLYNTFARYCTPQAHRLGKERRIFYYRHDKEGRNFERWLAEIALKKPQMLKIYAHRFNYQLSDSQLDRIYGRIWAACLESSEPIPPGL